ncbi:MAG: iron uptake porin [Cyanobacteria bacterium P01_A01_bin.37]
MSLSSVSPAIANESSNLLSVYALEGLGTTGEMAQVTSVSQLSDVQPTDWAFQALQSLVERYGCIAGYPDGTYRGNRAMSRYEFAAGLNACLDRINELIAAGLADKVSREDLAVLQRLQEEFAAELATLRGRVDALEARTAELEANQFSTTTKLGGEVIFLTSAVIDEDDAFDDQSVFGYRARLNFDTSFTGEDRLRTRLEAEEILDFEGEQLGFQAGGDSGGSFELDDLIYSFPLFGFAEIVVGANGLDIDNDYSDSISPLDSSGSGAISEFADPRQYEQAFPGSGAGIGGSFSLIENDDFGLSLDVGYVADDPASPEEQEGLFNGNYAASAQLTFTSDFVDAGFMYANSFAVDSDEFDQDVYGDFLGGTPASANTYGAQVNFKINDTFEIGGGIAFSDVQQIGGAEDFDLWSYQGTIAINDVLGEGNLLGILVGVPSYTRDLEGATDDTAILAEVFYRYYVNDNIHVTPSFIVNTDPLNDNDNDASFIGAIRTTFKF